MNPWVQTIVTVVCSVFASSGLWAFISTVINNKKKRDNSEDERIKAIENMVRGLAHAKIVEIGKRYLEQGRITLDDLDEFNKYLYFPYSAMGGNGYAKKIADEVNKLPLDIVESRKESRYD